MDRADGNMGNIMGGKYYKTSDQIILDPGGISHACRIGGVEVEHSHSMPLQWRHNEHDGVSNHQPHNCLLNYIFRTDQRKHQRSAVLALLRAIPRTNGQ